MSARATFAGGCFWCTETAFDTLPGVSAVVSGYTGGQVENPTYEQVCSGTTGHAEAVQVEYDPARISYGQLLEAFWRSIDPTDAGGQFHDRGSQYRTAVFVHDAQQRQEAEASKAAVAERLGAPVATGIEEAGVFYPAEDYHQGYHAKNPFRYACYRLGSGRDKALEKIWRE